LTKVNVLYVLVLTPFVHENVEPVGVKLGEHSTSAASLPGHFLTHMPVSKIAENLWTKLVSLNSGM